MRRFVYLKWRGNWTREVVATLPVNFVFGDNVERVGMGGQACIRGLPNAFGVATKWTPGMREHDFFSDSNLINCCEAIERDVMALPSGVLVFSESGLGTGLAELPTRAPKVFAYMNELFGDLGDCWEGYGF